MEQAVLTPTQTIAVRAVAGDPQLANFYLSGGTALSGYYLRHRESDDLDFFCRDAFDVSHIHAFVEQLKTLLSATSIRFEKLYDRNQFFFALPEGELKVEFSLYPFNQLEAPAVQDGLHIDSLRDIATNKLMALMDRFDPKDFVDLFFLIPTSSLEVVRADVEKKFGVTISPLSLGQEFAKVRRIASLPKMIKPCDIEELKSFFTEKAKGLGAQFLN